VAVAGRLQGTLEPVRLTHGGLAEVRHLEGQFRTAFGGAGLDEVVEFERLQEPSPREQEVARPHRLDHLGVLLAARPLDGEPVLPDSVFDRFLGPVPERRQ
jgi:hypothetical protein